jgi:uncharacterized protein (DUF58 family)
MFKGLVNLLNFRYRQWIERRIPRAQSVLLNQRRIFIFPTRAGFSFLGLLLLMLIAAINYQNNMAFALVFLLACVFFVSILHTYANLSGLTIKTLGAKAGFVGDNIPFKLQLFRQGRSHYYDISLSWAGSDKELVCLLENSELVLSLRLLAENRGYFKPGRLLIETFYPVGLLRAWTWIALEFDALVYPRPLPADIKALPASDGEEGEAMLADGSDDFYGFRDYHPGDPLKHVFWKGYAKGQELQLKQYTGYREKQLWLDWEAFDGPLEKRLSHLCYWALKLEHRKQEYGLRLPGQEIPPAMGGAHQIRVLRALALFNSGEH